MIGCSGFGLCPLRLPAGRRAAAALLSLMVAAGSPSARAEVRVEGDVAAVRVEASRAAIADVLAALGRTLNVRYRSAAPLEDVVSGAYAGPLAHVVSRLLDGYDHVIKQDGGGIEVVVVGRRGDRAVAVEAPKPPLLHSATQWRASSAKTAAPRP